jgi:hypothetical protein
MKIDSINIQKKKRSKGWFRLLFKLNLDEKLYLAQSIRIVWPILNNKRMFQVLFIVQERLRWCNYMKKKKTIYIFHFLLRVNSLSILVHSLIVKIETLNKIIFFHLPKSHKNTTIRWTHTHLFEID